MTAMGQHAAWGREARLPWVRAALFGAALLVSLALHGILLAEIPMFPLGRPSVPLAQPTRPLVLEDVRPAPERPRFVQPEAFRPENPEAFADVEPLQKSLLEEMRAGAEAVPFTAPEIAEAPAPLPDRVPEPMDLRQEMLLIEQRRADAELAALPRRVAPVVERVSGAPDVTLPADPQAVAEAAEAAGGAGGAWTGLSVLAAAPPAADAVAEAVAVPEPTEAERLAEQSEMLDETPAEVTDIEPIERLLAVDVTTYLASEEDALYFELAVSRAGVEALPVLPKDILLIQDCSESITRTKLDFFKEGLVDILRTLTTVDRINLMRYSDSPELCFEDWTPVTAESLAEAVRFVDRMRARGQTDLFTPLKQVLDLPRSENRPMIAILLTDGRPTMGTVGSSDIIARFGKSNKGEISVFTLGAGDRVNIFLLDLLGHNNRGGSWIMPLREQIPAAAKRAGRELSRPVLTGLEYRFSGDSEAEVYPAAPTHLYLDRPLRLVGRCPAGQQTAVFQVLGESGDRRRDMVFALDLAGADDGGEGIRREWVAQKIYRLINDHLTSGRADTLEEIRALSERHNVPLPYGADFPL